MSLGNQYVYQNATRTKISVDTWDAVNLVWNVASSWIYQPNANMPEEYTSAQMKYVMANGSNGYIVPEQGYRREPLTFQFLELVPTDPFIAQMKSWVQTNQLVRFNLTDGTQVIGNFIKHSRVWLTNDVAFDLQTIFERTTE